MIFDSHAHYNDSKFSGERDALLKSIFNKNVGAVINASVNPEDSRRSLELCEAYPQIFAAVGIHPSDIEKAGALDTAIAEIEALASHDKAVAIGEIGLDYYWEPYDKHKQKAFFTAQLELARKLTMPVVIHDRDAHGDTDEILEKYTDVKAVLHSFSGSGEWAKELVRDGRYISFSGVLTIKNARKTVEAAKVVPLERILIETDAPYLAPTPLRGSINNSGNLIYVASVLADIKGVTAEKILDITFENACRFFNIDRSSLK